jgi:hypothetical protein
MSQMMAQQQQAITNCCVESPLYPFFLFGVSLSTKKSEEQIQY